MYHALEGLKGLVDSNLDSENMTRIETQLAIARRSDQAEIVSLANALNDYLQDEKGRLHVTKKHLETSHRVDRYSWTAFWPP